MKKSLSLCALIAAACFLNQAQAEIEFAFAIKEQVSLQYGNMEPETPFEWAFGAGVDGDNQITGGTITYPGSQGSVNLPNDGDAYELDITGYTAQTFLDNDYPDGSYTMTITDGGSPTILGPYSLTGSAYPSSPHILNAQGLNFHDLTQDYTLQWEAFAGADADDQVLLQIWDNDADEDLVAEFLAGDSTSFLLPGGTFTANKDYEVDVIFINTTDVPASETPETIIGFISTTRSVLSTSPQTPEEECIYISRGTFADQLSAAIPTTFEYSFFAEAFGRGFSSATVIKPNDSEAPMQVVGSQFSPGEFDLEEEYATAQLRDAEYPEGNYSVRVVDNAVTTTHGPFNLSGGTLPVTPGITNWTAAQSINPDQEFTLLLTPFSNAAAGAGIEFELVNTANFENRLEWDVPSTESEISISGDFLQPNSTYEGELIYINPALPQQNSSGVLIDVVYEVAIAFTIQTGASGGGGGGDGGDILISRGITTSQTSATLPSSGQFHFLAEGNGNTFTSVTLIKPDTSEVIVPMNGSAEFDLTESFGTEGERDAAYPEGDYSVRIIDGGVTNTHGPISQSAGTIPVIPGITNWPAAQSIDPDQDFLLSWTPFSNSGDEAQIELEIYNNNDQSNEMDWILASDTGSILLPSSFLQPNSTYSCEIIFINPAIFPTISGNVLLESYYEVFTSFTLQTGAGNGGGGGGGDPGIDFISQSSHKDAVILASLRV